jgi:hypothetical protein
MNALIEKNGHSGDFACYCQTGPNIAGLQGAYVSKTTLSVKDAALAPRAAQSIADIVKTMPALPVLDHRPMKQVLYGDDGLPVVPSGTEQERDKGAGGTT